MTKYIDKQKIWKLKPTREIVDPLIFDLIKREAFFMGFDDALRQVDGLPGEDVRPVRHGWWNGDGCSVCKHTVAIKQNGDIVYLHDIMQLPFCPNCGAQMLAIVPEVE